MKINNALALFLLLGACVLALNNVANVLTWHVAIPFSDEWNVFPRIIALQEAGFPIRDVLVFLWQQHNEHRIVVPKAIYLIDMTCFGYKGYFPLVCIFLFQTILVGMLVWLLVNKNREPWANWLLVSFITIAAFDLVQSENFLSTFQTSFVGCFAFSVAALVAYAKYVVNERRMYFLAAAIFATLSSLSLASGLFVWLALAVLAYLTHEKRCIQPLIFISVFAACLLLYLHGYNRPAQHASPVDSIMHQPMMVLNYLTVWLGNIAGTVSSAKIFGSIGLLMMLATTIFLVQNKSRRGRIEIYVLIAICLFVLMCGFVTSLGRINFGVEQAMAGRYGTPVLIFWFSLLTSIFLLALESRRALFIRSAVVLVLVAVVGLLVTNSRGKKFMVDFQNQQTNAYLAVLTGGYVEQPQLLLPIYPVPSLIVNKIDLLKSHNLSSFNATDASPFKIGGVFSPLIMQKSGDCKGHVDSVTKIAKDTYQLTGWAWSDASRSYPEWIYLVKGGKVIGLGKPGVRRPDVLAAVPSIKKIRVGWQGFARSTGDIGLDNIEAYISTQSGEYCRL